MTEQECRFYTYCWSAIVVFAALIFLTGAMFKSLLIALFVLVSTQLGFGRRWLLPASFAAAILAIAVSLGFPHPEQWTDLVKSAPDAIHGARMMLSAVVSH
jgi:hypothetical protein